jgi:site-specific recombinase XerD
MYVHTRIARSGDAVTKRNEGGSSDGEDLQTLIDLYLLRCQVEGKSPNTLKAYAWTLRRFLDVARQEGFAGPVRQITPVHLYSYLGRFSHLSAESRHRYHREVSFFFSWLESMRYVDRSAFAQIKKVKLPQRIIQPFSQDDVRSLLGLCDDSPVGRRDRALLLVMLDTGVRVSELVQLHLADVDLDTGRIRVLHGKGNKQRVVAFGEGCKDGLLSYLQARGYEPGPLFVAVTGHRRLHLWVGLRPNGVKQMLRRLGRSAGLPKVHAHRFRHTFATWCIEQHARELDVQYLLGHSTSDMVRRYSATYNSEQAACAHAAFSPANRLGAVPASAELGGH